MDTDLSKLWEIVEDRGALYAIVHSVSKSRTQLSNWTTRHVAVFLKIVEAINLREVIFSHLYWTRLDYKEKIYRRLWKDGGKSRTEWKAKFFPASQDRMASVLPKQGRHNCPGLSPGRKEVSLVTARWSGFRSNPPQSLWLRLPSLARAGLPARVLRMPWNAPHLSLLSDPRWSVHADEAANSMYVWSLHCSSRLLTPRSGLLLQRHIASPKRTEAFKDLDSKQSWCAVSSCPELSGAPKPPEAVGLIWPLWEPVSENTFSNSSCMQNTEPPLVTLAVHFICCILRWTEGEKRLKLIECIPCAGSFTYVISLNSQA